MSGRGTLLQGVARKGPVSDRPLRKTQTHDGGARQEEAGLRPATMDKNA